jgi:hypothetical protein
MNKSYIFVLALVLVGTGLLVYARTAKVPTPTQTTASSTPLIVEKITPTAKISTEGWKTCRNEKRGYEFQYPKEWYSYVYDNGTRLVQNGLCNGINVSVTAVPNFISGTGYSQETYTNGIEFGVGDSVGQRNLLDIVHDKAIQEKFGTNPFSDGKMILVQDKLWKFVYVLHDGVLFHISALVVDGEATTGIFPDDLLETMLSTFKFLK